MLYNMYWVQAAETHGSAAGGDEAKPIVATAAAATATVVQGDKETILFRATPGWGAPEMVHISAAAYSAMLDFAKQDLYRYADRFSLGLTCAFLVLGPNECKKMRVVFDGSVTPEEIAAIKTAAIAAHKDAADVILALMDETAAARCRQCSHYTFSFA
jgi:hypothetical protein